MSAKAKRVCVVCHLRPPTVPDRNVMGRQVNRICSECHAARLRGDLKLVLAQYDTTKKAPTP